MKRIIIMLAVCICNYISVFAQSENWKLYHSSEYSFIYPTTWKMVSGVGEMDVVLTCDEQYDDFTMNINILKESTRGLSHGDYVNAFCDTIKSMYGSVDIDGSLQVRGVEDVYTLTYEFNYIGRELCSCVWIYWKDHVAYVMTLVCSNDIDDHYEKLLINEGIRILDSFRFE